MFRTPQKRGGAANLFGTPHRSPNKTIALNGLFVDGTWNCNCEPRLPASQFQVKKEGRNQGRWFYTCQHSQDNGCGFFLWDDDAAPREMRAVINNSRTEPDGLRTPASVKEESSLGRNSIQNLGKQDKGAFGECSIPQDEVAEVTYKVDERRFQSGPFPETPRKTIKTDHFMAPGSKRKREEDALPTPISGRSRDEDIFTSSKQKGKIWDESSPFGLRSPSTTPTPSRFRDATELLEGSREKNKMEHDITDEVMELLKDQNIDDKTISDLRQLLTKHAMKNMGIARGRDITRVALKAKDAKIAELQQKIAAMENEREMDKTIIKHFKSDTTDSLNSRHGKGWGQS